MAGEEYHSDGGGERGGAGSVGERIEGEKGEKDKGEKKKNERWEKNIPKNRDGRGIPSLFRDGKQISSLF